MRHAFLFVVAVLLALGARFLFGPLVMMVALVVAVVAMWFLDNRSSC